MVTALAIHDTPRHGLDGPDLNLKTSGRVSGDMAEITYGNPGFGNYAYVDTNEYLLHYVEPVVEIATPQTPDQSSSVPGASGGGSLWDSFNGMCDSINDFINKAVFVTEIDLENSNVAAVRAQNQMMNEAAGAAIRPDRGAYDMMKTLGGTVSGIAGIAISLEEATNTENSLATRAINAAVVTLAGAGVLGAVASYGDDVARARQISQDLPAELKQNFKCKEYSDEFIGQLQRHKISGRKLTIEVENRLGKYPIIALRETGETISDNGIHIGVQVSDMIFDNLFPFGIKADEWFGKFVTNRLHELKRPAEVLRF